MNIPDADTLRWIIDNAKADTDRLRLRHHGDEDKAFAIMQIECRRKAATKLERTLSLIPDFIFPTALSAEQCTGDRLAEFHSELMHGDTLLDMTSGLGIDAMHFAQAHPQAAVTTFDINHDIAQALAHNAHSASLGNIDVRTGDSVRFLTDTDCRFDTIFIDPARRGGSGRRLFALSDCNPDVTQLLPLLKSRCKRLIIKASPMLDITAVTKELKAPAQIFAVGTTTECKELVAVIDFDSSVPAPSAPTITAVTLSAAIDCRFTFTAAEEHLTQPTFAVPQTGDILYSPWKSVIKAAPFRCLSTRTGAHEIAPLTHLYTSQALLADFPGMPLEIIDILPFNKHSIRHIGATYRQINVTCRNFPLSADALAKRLRITQGGTLRLFAASVPAPTLIICSPLDCK